MIAGALPAWGMMLLAWLVGVQADPQADFEAIEACLDLQDVACAQAVVRAAGMEQSADGGELATAAHVALHAGDYPRAFDLADAATKAGWADKYELRALTERTTYATAGWVEVKRDGFRVRYRPGADAILVDDVIEVLRRVDRFITPLLGERPPGETIVELYPDGRSFIAASSLTKDDVDSTGVVALSKWTRLLVTSPRALGRGYDWKQTLAHEYVHLIVGRNSADRAPVWLQEAIAKYLDNRWETGEDLFKLSGESQRWFAEALGKNDLVPFEEMRISLAKIKVLNQDGSIDAEASAQRASVAYSQLSTLMQYAFEQGGPDVLLRALPLVREGVDPGQALATAAGAAGFDVFNTAWEAWVRAQPLVVKRIASMPTVLDGGSADELDPVLSRRRDLANFVRLGDLLYEASRYRAALVEYDKAQDPEESDSPLLGNRIARALVASNDLDGASRRLDAVAADYPEYALTWQQKGALEQKRGRPGLAIEALNRAVALDPFHLATQQGLLELYKETGDPRAQTQERVMRVLRTGGEDVDLPPLHERSGTYELPRSPEATAKATDNAKVGLEGRPAPDFEVAGLDGQPVKLSALKGRVVLVDFWATWCGPCRQVMPALSKLAESEADAVSVVGISDESPAVVSKFVETEVRRGRVYKQTLATENGVVRRAYGVSSLPTLVIIDKLGVVRKVHVGAGSMSEVTDLVQTLRAE